MSTQSVKMSKGQWMSNSRRPKHMSIRITVETKKRKKLTTVGTIQGTSMRYDDIYMQQ